MRTVLDDPAAAQRRAVAARQRLTSDFDWHTVAVETAQVYLAAKRREREPQPRRPIVEHAAARPRPTDLGICRAGAKSHVLRPNSAIVRLLAYPRLALVAGDGEKQRR